jgi:hypothetical protein
MLPLLYPGQSRAPWSPSTCTRFLSLIASSHRWESLLVGRLWLDFPTIFTVFPSRLSHLAVPAVDLSHSLAFDSLTSCEVDDMLWCACYP